MPYKRLIIQVRVYVVGVIHELPPEVWPKRAIRELPLHLNGDVNMSERHHRLYPVKTKWTLSPQ